MDIVDKITHQYTVVKNLQVLKHGFHIKTIRAVNSTGLSVKDIATFILENCQYILPVNIVTNNTVLWAICKYIFSTYLDINEWKIIPVECYVNKKNVPKVMIWNVCNQICKDQLLTINPLKEFIDKFPKYQYNHITFQKKHVYIQRVPFSKDNNFNQQPQNVPPPYSFISKKYGTLNCHDQGNSECVVNIFLSKNHSENTRGKLKEILSYLSSKKFVKLYSS